MKLRLVPVSVLTVLLIGAIVVSPASAAFKLLEPKCTEGKTSICYDTLSEGTNLRELSGEQELQAKLKTGTTATFTAETKPEWILLCTEVGLGAGSVILQAEPLVKETSLDFTSFAFKGCKVDSPSNCNIPASLTTNAITGVAVNQSVALEGWLLKPTSGGAWFELKLTGEECLLKGTQAVKGSQILLFSNDGVDLLAQEATTELAESKLEFGASAVKMTLVWALEITLPGLEDPWDIVQA
jgi:hypothetical protein